MGTSFMANNSVAARAAKALLSACVALAATGLAATPAWAKARRPVTTTTAALLTSTTTTVGTMPTPTPPVPAPADTCGKSVWPSRGTGPSAILPGG